VIACRRDFQWAEDDDLDAEDYSDDGWIVFEYGATRTQSDAKWRRFRAMENTELATNLTDSKG